MSAPHERGSMSTALLLTLIISLSILQLSAPTVVAGGSVYVSKVTVTSSAGTPEVYPGSTGVSIVVDEVNGEYYSITNVEACLKLPEGFTPAYGSGTCVMAVSPNETYKTSFDPGEIFQFKFRVNIDRSVKPGTYCIRLNVTYTVESPTPKRKSALQRIYVKVSEYPTPELRVVDVWWGSDKVFPGTEGADLNIMLENVGDVRITGGYAKLILPQPLTPSAIRSSMPSLNRNDRAVLTFSNIGIPLDALPGVYVMKLLANVTAVTEDGVDYRTFIEADFEVNITTPKQVNLSLVNAVWTRSIAYGESRSLNLEVVLQNLDQVTIDQVVARLRLPEGYTWRNGSQVVVTTVGGPIRYGEVFTITFSDINASVAEAESEFAVELRILANYRGAEFLVTQELTFTAGTSAEEVLYIVSQRWVYNGVNAWAFPSARGINLEIRLANLGEDPITAVIPKLKLPEGFTLKSISGDCLTAGIRAGGVGTLTFTIDIADNVKPGLWNATLLLDYVVSTGTSYLYGSKEFSIKLVVSNPEDFRPKLQITKMWWGTTQPQTVYPGERSVPVHVEVVNVGRYPASSVLISIEPINESVTVIEGSALGATTLNSGTSCRAVFYVDLGNVSVGNLHFKVVVRYVFELDGAFVNYTEEYVKSLKVEKYAALRSAGIEIVDYGWLNNQPVFPNTENATYTVQLANNYPFNVAGIKAVLKLPKGMWSKEGRVATAYVEGPIGTHRTFTLDFTVCVGDVRPGRYDAVLDLKYTVLTGGACIEKEAVFNISILVNKIVHGLEYVASGWYGKSGEPGTYGNMLYVIVRNTDFPSITGVVAEVTLPEGMVSSINNESRVKVVPTAVTLTPAAPAAGARGVSIPGIGRVPISVSAPVVGQQVAPFNKGDTLTFVIPVNILNVTPGTYYALMNVSFIDHWGNLRSYTLKVPIHVLGTTKIVSVWTDGTLKFERREGVMRVKVLNIGTSPIYNVYLNIIPTTGNLLVKRTTYYIGELEPGKIKEVSVTVYFNPIPTQAGITLTYGSIPFTAAVIYTDVNGNNHVVNMSFSVVVEPYIELQLSDIRAVWSAGELRVSGTITNLGNAQAQRIEVIVIAGGKRSEPYFVGDLDPSSQTSFTVKLSTGPVDEATIILMYRDPFNELLSVNATAHVEVENVTTTTTAPSGPLGGWTNLGIIIVVVAVVIFLVLVGLAIRSYLRKHRLPETYEGGV